MMKGLTVWQPWALLLGCGAKKYETRSWETRYRGPIAIHAAQKSPMSILRHVCLRVVNAMTRALGFREHDRLSEFVKRLDCGCIIAVADLVNCHPISDAETSRIMYSKSPAYASVYKDGPCIKSGAKVEFITGNELLFGDWSDGRFAWEFANMRMLPKPIPYRGAQGLWNIDEQIINQGGGGL